MSEQLREAMVGIAREIEACKRECGMDPEAPTAIHNGRLMDISYKLRALAAQPASPASLQAIQTCIEFAENGSIRGKPAGWHTDMISAAKNALRSLATPQPLPTGPREGEPIDMVLHCPKCGAQHIDAPEKSFHELTGPEWTNPPHRSHLCHHCGVIWRPADVPTNGVAAVKTKGKADRALASPETPSVRGEINGCLACVTCGHPAEASALQAVLSEPQSAGAAWPGYRTRPRFCRIKSNGEVTLSEHDMELKTGDVLFERYEYSKERRAATPCREALAKVLGDALGKWEQSTIEYFVEPALADAAIAYLLGDPAVSASLQAVPDDSHSTGASE